MWWDEVLNFIYINLEYFIILYKSFANRLNFGPVEEQSLKYVALKCVSQIFVKNKMTVCRKKWVCTYRTAVSLFCKNNDLLCLAQNHENSPFPQGINCPKISLWNATTHLLMEVKRPFWI